MQRDNTEKEMKKMLPMMIAWPFAVKVLLVLMIPF